MEAVICYQRRLRVVLGPLCVRFSEELARVITGQLAENRRVIRPLIVILAGEPSVHPMACLQDVFLRFLAGCLLVSQSRGQGQGEGREG